jgi:hypothetical protein
MIELIFFWLLLPMSPSRAAACTHHAASKLQSME